MEHKKDRNKVEGALGMMVQDMPKASTGRVDR